MDYFGYSCILNLRPYRSSKILLIDNSDTHVAPVFIYPSLYTSIAKPGILAVIFCPFPKRKLKCLTISSVWLVTHRSLPSSYSLDSSTSSFWGKPHITVHTTEITVNPKILKPNSYWQRVPMSKGGRTSLPQTPWSVLPRLKYCSKLYFD